MSSALIVLRHHCISNSLLLRCIADDLCTLLGKTVLIGTAKPRPRILRATFDPRRSTWETAQQRPQALSIREEGLGRRLSSLAHARSQ